MADHLLLLLLLAIGLAHLAGLLSVVHVVNRGRTVQGTIAWAVALLTLPYLSLPFYWVVGRYRYEGYLHARRARDQRLAEVVQGLRDRAPAFAVEPQGDAARFAVLSELAHLPFTRGNRVELLVDGEATFGSLLDGIARAERYVLAQFYVVRHDATGQRFKRALIERARAGVRVMLLYDVIGSYALAPQYLADLREAGVEVHAFGTLRKRRNRLQINFRNHRKVTIVDGCEAWVGGFNVGDEYVVEHPRFGAWRDTHARVEGPSVTGLQLTFLEDWHWATGSVPDLEWTAAGERDADQVALVLPSSPADERETCSLFFVHAIHSAQRRLWIASPYFVPDEPVVDALQLAALRGVDVRILIPERADNVLVWLSSYAYVEQMLGTGVRIWRYQPGFLHQKVLLVDDDLASVTTANLDNRSFRLNFEVGLVVLDQDFASAVEAMLERDLAQSRLATRDDLERRRLWFRIGTRLSRLLAPVQ